MPTYNVFKDLQNLEGLRSVAERTRIVHVVRPILMHDRSATGKPCPCCGSKYAGIVEERPHLECLFDTMTGARRVRRPHNAEIFDSFVQRHASAIKRIDMPLRCYAEQLPIILDRKHKVIGVFGGSRAGKTETAKEWLVDQWIEKGGRGASFWWVAPTRDQARDPGLAKLAIGERTDRHNKPAFPPELVRYIPPNVQSPRQFLLLVDGSRIDLKYASRDGRHLRGKAAQAVILDEGTAVDHEINWTTLINRTRDTKGQILTCTTPKAGHWLLKLKQRAESYDDAEIGSNKDEVSATLNCRRNPWTDLEEVERDIRVNGGPEDPRVKREIFGEWVGEGNILWRHWDRKVHIFEGAPRDPEHYGLLDITPHAVRAVFGQTTNARKDWIAGWDVNDFPQSVLLCKVVCDPKADQSDRKNWRLWVRDAFIRRATVYDLADYLAEKGGLLLGTQGGVGNLGIICDPNACFPRTRVNQQSQSSDADVLRSRGMVVRSPVYKDNKPAHLSIRNRVNNLHQLMFEKRLLVHGSIPKLIDGIESQVADVYGEPEKESNTASDRASGPPDALGYLAWGIFGKAERPKVEW